jgi:hypothetical protein
LVISVILVKNVKMTKVTKMTEMTGWIFDDFARASIVLTVVGVGRYDLSQVTSRRQSGCERKRGV